MKRKPSKTGFTKLLSVDTTWMSADPLILGAVTYWARERSPVARLPKIQRFGLSRPWTGQASPAG
ncbi:hypothetical protein BQ8482_380307 [Mesorhizobium delmotii]|uniref:Uncharacterized protein n=1 Tax=Mesorhizobium delmotii TaxID=1631247 RepID=A0A2P9ASN6_9HYPH|nr:hypothetical protein BQ8482_380307 [Mesorhizobium delmotii]